MSGDIIQEKKGYNGTIRVYADYIELDRTKSRFIAAFTSGLHGIKRIYFKDIGSINFKKKGLAVGWIQFSVLGGRDTSSVMETIYNENTITFNKKNEEWEQIFQFIQNLLDDFKKMDRPKEVTSITDELEKAAKLLNNGVISEEEFTKLKEKILS